MEEEPGTNTNGLGEQARGLVRENPWIILLTGVVLMLLLLLAWSTASPESFTPLFESLESTDILNW